MWCVVGGNGKVELAEDAQSAGDAAITAVGVGGGGLGAGTGVAASLGGGPEEKAGGVSRRLRICRFKNEGPLLGAAAATGGHEAEGG